MSLQYLVKLDMLIALVLPLSCVREKLQNLSFFKAKFHWDQFFVTSSQQMLRGSRRLVTDLLRGSRAGRQLVTRKLRGSWQRRQQFCEEVNDIMRELRRTGPSGIWP